jgi:hypothetical protein
MHSSPRKNRNASDDGPSTNTRAHTHISTHTHTHPPTHTHTHDARWPHEHQVLDVLRVPQRVARSEVAACAVAAAVCFKRTAGTARGDTAATEAVQGARCLTAQLLARASTTPAGCPPEPPSHAGHAGQPGCRTKAVAHEYERVQPLCCAPPVEPLQEKVLSGGAVLGHEVGAACCLCGVVVCVCVCVCVTRAWGGTVCGATKQPCGVCPTRAQRWRRLGLNSWRADACAGGATCAATEGLQRAAHTHLTALCQASPLHRPGTLATGPPGSWQPQHNTHTHTHAAAGVDGGRANVRAHACARSDASSTRATPRTPAPAALAVCRAPRPCLKKKPVPAPYPGHSTMGGAAGSRLGSVVVCMYCSGAGPTGTSCTLHAAPLRSGACGSWCVLLVRRTSTDAHAHALHSHTTHQPPRTPQARTSAGGTACRARPPRPPPCWWAASGGGSREAAAGRPHARPLPL